MHPHLLFVFLLLSQILIASEPIEVMLKAKQVKDELRVKFLLKTHIVTPEVAEIKNIPLYYIKSVLVETDDETLVTAYLSPYFTSTASFKFSKNITSKNINLLVTDNNGRTVRKSKPIKSYLPTTPSTNINKAFKDLKSPSSNVFKAVSSDDAIKALYGTTQTVEGNFKIEFKGDSLITLDDGTCTGNGGDLRIGIQTDIKLSSLAIFQDANRYSTIAVFYDDQSSIHYYGLNFKMRKTSIIRVVGIGTDGVLYESQSKMYIIPGSHRDCYGNVNGPYMVY